MVLVCSLSFFFLTTDTSGGEGGRSISVCLCFARRCDGCQCLQHVLCQVDLTNESYNDFGGVRLILRGFYVILRGFFTIIGLLEQNHGPHHRWEISWKPYHESDMDLRMRLETLFRPLMDVTDSGIRHRVVPLAGLN